MKRKSYFSVALLVLGMFVFGGCGGGGGGGGGDNPPVPPVTDDAKVMREHNTNFINLTEETFVKSEALRELLEQDLNNLSREEVLSLSGKLLDSMEKWDEYYSALVSLSSESSQNELGLKSSSVAPQGVKELAAEVGGYYIGGFIAGIVQYFDQKQVHEANVKAAYKMFETSTPGSAAEAQALKIIAGSGASLSKSLGSAISTVHQEHIVPILNDPVGVTLEVLDPVSLVLKGFASEKLHAIIDTGGSMAYLANVIDKNFNKPIVIGVPEGETNVAVTIVQGEEKAPIQFDVEVDPENTVVIDLSGTPSVEDAQIGQKIVISAEEEPVDITEAISVMVRCNPSSPFEYQTVTATATVFPAIAGVDVTFSVVGTDGYKDSGTRKTNSSGQISFTIPGAEASVRDVVKVTIPNGTSFQAVYTFQPLLGTSGSGVNRTRRVGK